MYRYYIQDDVTGMCLIGRMKMGTPVHTCIWGDRAEDIMTFKSALAVRNAALEMTGNSVSIYRISVRTGEITKQKSTGGDDQ